MAIAGALIKEIRESRGKKQIDMAKMIGKTQGYIARLEADELRGGIKGDELLKIARGLEYNPFVFSGEIDLAGGDLRRQSNANEMEKLILKIEDQAQIIERYKNLVVSNEYDKIKLLMENKPVLKDIIFNIMNWDEALLQRLKDFSSGCAAGVENEKNKTVKKEDNSNSI
ncbi:MAG: helix-turn-helix transcriptional regulator [Spirochaetales bacterium]|nr:helix-turn-helix transcriptional regulator [Spirochaetales bacterium]